MFVAHSEDELQAAMFYVTNDLPKYHMLNIRLVDGNPELEQLKENIERLNEQAYYMGIIEGIKRKNIDIEHDSLQLPVKNIKPVLELFEKYGRPDDKEYLSTGLKKLHNIGFLIGWYNLHSGTSDKDLPHLYEKLSKLE